MIQYHSFKPEETEKINELLQKNRMAKGAHVLISNGFLVFPVEDGTPPTVQQQVIEILEERNAAVAQIAIIEHSQRVNDQQIIDAKDKLNQAKAQYSGYKSNKEFEKKMRQAEDSLSQLEGIYEMNKHEITRLKINIDIFDDRIAELEAKK